jgi:Secretion system C-terminal sorting domain
LRIQGRIENTGLSNVNATGNYVNIDFLVHRLGNYIVSPTLGGGGVLPIKLLSFEGTPETNRIKLNWKTTNEVNNSHFEVLKLAENNTYKSIGRVNAKKESSGVLKDYSLYDINPKKGINFYQLKQYDVNGTTSLPKIVAVNFGLKSIFSIYPNPVKVGESIRLKLINTDNQVDIQLIDMSQRIVLQKTFEGTQNNIELSTAAFKPGVYILKVRTMSGQYVNKIIVTP